MLQEVAQLLVNGLVAGTQLAVPAIGFTAIYAVLRFPNFAVASHATIGAFAGYVANVHLGVPVVVSSTADCWEIQKTLTIRQPLEGYGRLLAELPK